MRCMELVSLVLLALAFFGCGCVAGGRYSGVQGFDNII